MFAAIWGAPEVAHGRVSKFDAFADVLYDALASVPQRRPQRHFVYERQHDHPWAARHRLFSRSPVSHWMTGKIKLPSIICAHFNIDVGDVKPVTKT